MHCAYRKAATEQDEIDDLAGSRHRALEHHLTPSLLVSTNLATGPPPACLPYGPPTQTTKLRNRFFGSFGPYPAVCAAIAAGMGDLNDSPPDWDQGAEGSDGRFKSNCSIVAVGMTTRYAPAECSDEGALYSRCDCTGVFPRLIDAVMISILAARSGSNS